MTMDGLATIFRDFTPGAYGIWTGVLMLAAWMLREYRETRKLSTGDRLARREGYARQVENLQTENRNLYGDLSRMRQEHDAYRELCHKETDALRQHVVSLENELAGLKRRFDTRVIYDARAGISGKVDE
jgi:hypothetical protein